MARSRLFDFSQLSKRELILVPLLVIAFLLFQKMVVGLLPAHILMVALFCLMFFAHPVSRKLAVALLPFVMFEISYDWMRLYPNYMVNDISIRGLYQSELQLFGVTSGGVEMIPSQYFNLHHTVLADLLAGVFYLCWVPVPMAFGVWLYFKGERKMYLHFALAFLFVNLVGFCGYYIYPAAPPWYALEHGFTPDFTTGGNVAGLARFDSLVGFPVFNTIYVNNSNIFAAVPSLHAAYMLVTTIYAVLSRRSWGTVALFVVITMGIWWTAVYTCHHYVIDVLLGIFTAFVGVAIFEKLLMRVPVFSRFVDGYVRYIN